MKKTLLAMAIAMCAVCGANAQTMFDSGDNTPKIGIRAEWNLNSPITNLNDYLSIYHNGSGFSVGAFYNIPLYKNLYFEPGLSLFYNTIIIAPDDVQALLLDYKVPPQGSLRNWGFRVPIDFGYKFNFTDDMALSLFTGPQINVGLALNQYVNGSKSSHSLYGNGWNRVDAQWAFGVRFHYADNWIAEIKGGIGMTNLLGGDFAKHNHFRRNTFSFGVGYVF